MKCGSGLMRSHVASLSRLDFDMRFAFLALLFIFMSPMARSADLLESSPEQRKSEDRRDGLEVYRHNLNYFISGRPDTKVQLSFKMRIVHDFDLFFAYTQTMFWDLFTKDSSPFTDLNYNPDLFYRWYLENGMFKGIDLGFEHRSNGRDQLDSRSWNRSYVTARTEFHIGPKRAEWNSKFYYFSQLDSTNQDIPYQLGFIETSLAVKDLFPSFLREAEIQLTITPGGTFELSNIRGSQELGFRFRLPVKSFDPFIYFQLYNGFNESLLFYKENRTTYRIGFAI
jgi:phospholipase A1